jgi:hypothetical protein
MASVPSKRDAWKHDEHVANNLEADGYVRDQQGSGEYYEPQEAFDRIMNKPEIQASCSSVWQCADAVYIDHQDWKSVYFLCTSRGRDLPAGLWRTVDHSRHFG